MSGVSFSDTIITNTNESPLGHLITQSASTDLRDPNISFQTADKIEALSHSQIPIWLKESLIGEAPAVESAVDCDMARESLAVLRELTSVVYKKAIEYSEITAPELSIIQKDWLETSDDYHTAVTANARVRESMKQLVTGILAISQELHRRSVLPSNVMDKRLPSPRRLDREIYALINSDRDIIDILIRLREIEESYSIGPLLPELMEVLSSRNVQYQLERFGDEIDPSITRLKVVNTTFAERQAGYGDLKVAVEFKNGKQRTFCLNLKSQSYLRSHQIGQSRIVRSVPNVFEGGEPFPVIACEEFLTRTGEGLQDIPVYTLAHGRYSGGRNTDALAAMTHDRFVAMKVVPILMEMVGVDLDVNSFVRRDHDLNTNLRAVFRHLMQ
jgi:hypothetical protein